MSKRLIEGQRYAIYSGIQNKWSFSAIAAFIGVSKSTVSREVARNSKPDGTYFWKIAQSKCDERRHIPPVKHRIDAILWWRIEQYIMCYQWSPRQILGHLAKEGIKVSHQAIYNHIHADTTGILIENTRHKLKYKRHKKVIPPTKVKNIPCRTSIHDRPIEANGKRFGDWEMDLIVDSHCHAILTLTEKSTNFLIMEKLRQGKNAMGVAKAVIRLLMPYRGFGVKTITTDNGSEFAAHRLITEKLGATVYFADSYCSWQKGSIENTNKLIRQYIPKKANLKNFTDKKIMKIQKLLNLRPREKLNFDTPKHAFFSHYL